MEVRVDNCNRCILIDVFLVTRLDNVGHHLTSLCHGRGIERRG